MFGDIGKLAGLMARPQRLREEMEKLQERLAQQTTEGNAGGGMVTVKVNGKCSILACRLSDDALKMQDREMLEDLIVAATNQALAKAQQLLAAETQKMAADLGLPPGLSLPGLS